MLFRPKGVAWSTICRPGKSPFSFRLVTGFPCPVPTRHSRRSPNRFRKGAGKELLDEEEDAERRRWAALSTNEKISDWAFKHQYPLIVGSWAASMGLAASIIMKDRFQSTSQKVREASLPLEGADWLVDSGRLFKLVCGHRD